MEPLAAGKLLVTTADGDVAVFSGFVSKMIVMHPRLAVGVTSLLAFALGFVLR